MYCSSPPIDGHAHEAEAELGQLVAPVERLRDAARPLGEDQERLALREQALRVLGHADDLADAREEERDERQAVRPLLHHRADDARGLGVHEHRGADEDAVDRELARVVRDEQDPTGRDVLDAVDLGAEVFPVERGDGDERVLRPLRVEAERVDPGGTQRQRDALEAFVERLAQQALERVVDSVLRRAEEAPQQAARARAARVAVPTNDRGGRTAAGGRRGRGSHRGVIMVGGRGRSMALCLRPVNLARPPPIAPGDLVSVVAPSSPVPRDEFWRGLAWLRARYRIQMSAGVFARDGYLAGSDERRKDEISRALMDDEVKAIVAARGGTEPSGSRTSCRGARSRGGRSGSWASAT
jgi:hypothetical protein